MSTRKSLLIGVSTLALTVAVAATVHADQTFTTNHTATATAGGNTSNQTQKFNKNENKGNAFQGATGVVSEVQNNGDNSALNNGNTVDATISTGVATGDVDYNATSAQTADVVSGSVANETNVNDDNIIEDFSFQNAEGVFSKLQNNGANSAVNNGNSVAAAILEGNTGGAVLQATSNQTATVTGGGSGNSYNAASSPNDNDIRGNAFENTRGVASVVQNNGPNSALNNGNTVAGVIGPSGSVSTNRRFGANSAQTARVNQANTSVETNSADKNQIRNEAFQDMEGVGSVIQNNGANSAANNGNSVAAIVTDNNAAAGAAGQQLGAGAIDATQQAFVGAFGANNSTLQNGSADTNLMTDNAFKEAEGVFSVLQNNGPNSALNNGNTVSAVIANGTVADNGLTIFFTDSTQNAGVASNNGTNSNLETGSADSNTISENAFQDPEGIVSALQNNGANSAANNGNTVAAVIAEANVTVATAAPVFTATSEQTAEVNAAGNNTNDEEASPNSNTITTNAFRSGLGVFSALQNNGANSALSNGNTVSAIVTPTAVATNAATDTFTTDANQTSTVSANFLAGGLNRTDQTIGTVDTNILSGAAFEDVQGIASVLQNNGANSAGNNGNTVTAIVNGGNIANAGADLFSTTSDQTALVDGGPVAGTAGNRSSEEGNSDDVNTVTDTVFRDAEGVVSVMQNNAGNSALNNGNTVSAFVSDGNVTGTGPVGFTTTSTQTATVQATDGVLTNFSNELDVSDDTNTINDNAFQNAQGVGSVMQNNGANSALNGGNTVSAIINGCTSCTGTLTFATTSTQTALVAAASSTATHSGDSNNTNTVAGSAFANVAGVFSVTQNNAPNSALNNGNTVSAVIVNN